MKNQYRVFVVHIPIELSKTFSRFLADYREIKTKCIGCRYNKGEDKGFDILVIRLIGNLKYEKHWYLDQEKKNQLLILIYQ